MRDEELRITKKIIVEAFPKTSVHNVREAVSLFLLFLFVSYVFIPSALADKIAQSRLREIEQQWQSSVHALAEVNCSSCHQDEETKAFIAKPTEESCKSCHENSVDTFLLGKHGIRTLEGLSPLTPTMAHLPMKESSLDKQMNCNTCHNVHTVNTYEASVDSCLTCHNDNHSLEKSGHYRVLIPTQLLVLPVTYREKCLEILF